MRETCCRYLIRRQLLVIGTGAGGAYRAMWEEGDGSFWVAVVVRWTVAQGTVQYVA